MLLPQIPYCVKVVGVNLILLKTLLCFYLAIIYSLLGPIAFYVKGTQNHGFRMLVILLVDGE